MQTYTANSRYPISQSVGQSVGQPVGQPINLLALQIKRVVLDNLTVSAKIQLAELERQLRTEGYVIYPIREDMASVNTTNNALADLAAELARAATNRGDSNDFNSQVATTLSILGYKLLQKILSQARPFYDNDDLQAYYIEILLIIEWLFQPSLPQPNVKYNNQYPVKFVDNFFIEGQEFTLIPIRDIRPGSWLAGSFNVPIVELFSQEVADKQTEEAIDLLSIWYGQIIKLLLVDINPLLPWIDDISEFDDTVTEIVNEKTRLIRRFHRRQTD